MHIFGFLVLSFASFVNLFFPDYQRDRKTWQEVIPALTVVHRRICNTWSSAETTLFYV